MNLWIFGTDCILMMHTLKRINFLKLKQMVVKFIPETVPEPDEITAIMEGRKGREEHGTIPHEAINWE